MLEGAKSMGAGAATIASAGAAVGIGNVFSSLIHAVAQSVLGETIIWLCYFGLCSNRSYCIVCPNDGLFDFIRIPIKESLVLTSLSQIGGRAQFLNRRMAIKMK